MISLRRLPIRTRVTAAFTAAMALLLLGIGLSVYWSMSEALLDELDSGLLPLPPRRLVPRWRHPTRGLRSEPRHLTSFSPAAAAYCGPVPGFLAGHCSVRGSLPRCAAPGCSSVTSLVSRISRACSPCQSATGHAG